MRSFSALLPSTILQVLFYFSNRLDVNIGSFLFGLVRYRFGKYSENHKSVLRPTRTPIATYFGKLVAASNLTLFFVLWN